MIRAHVPGLVLELSGLPPCAIAAALTDEGQVAAETFKAARAKRRRHLALHSGLSFGPQAALGTVSGISDSPSSSPPLHPTSNAQDAAIALTSTTRRDQALLHRTVMEPAPRTPSDKVKLFRVNWSTKWGLSFLAVA